MLRTLFFLSQVLSVTVVTLIWQIMFSPRQGLIANVTQALGGTPVTWLTNEQFAMAAIVITTVWWSLGIAMILFLAGIPPPPPPGHLARHLRGRGDRQCHRACGAFRYITTAQSHPDHHAGGWFLQIILHFQVFGQAHLMTQGGPNGQHAGPGALHLPDRLPATASWAAPAPLAVFLFVIMGGFSVIQFISSDGERD